MLPYFEKILPLVCDVLYKMRYILWVVALLGACDVTIYYCRSSHKKAKIDIFNATQVEYDIIKHFASLSFIT